MGSISIWHWIIAVAIFVFIMWLFTRQSKRTPTTSSSDSPTDTVAFQVGQKLGRVVLGAKDRAGASRSRLKIEAKAAKYDALAKLKSLHESGVISDSEYEAEKLEILGK